jgi:hypothetical protein
MSRRLLSSGATSQSAFLPPSFVARNPRRTGAPVAKRRPTFGFHRRPKPPRSVLGLRVESPQAFRNLSSRTLATPCYDKL